MENSPRLVPWLCAPSSAAAHATPPPCRAPLFRDRLTQSLSRKSSGPWESRAGWRGHRGIYPNRMRQCQALAARWQAKTRNSTPLASKSPLARRRTPCGDPCRGCSVFPGRQSHVFLHGLRTRAPCVWHGLSVRVAGRRPASVSYVGRATCPPTVHGLRTRATCFLHGLRTRVTRASCPRPPHRRLPPPCRAPLFRDRLVSQS